MFPHRPTCPAQLLSGQLAADRTTNTLEFTKHTLHTCVNNGVHAPCVLRVLFGYPVVQQQGELMPDESASTTANTYITDIADLR